MPTHAFSLPLSCSKGHAPSSISAYLSSHYHLRITSFLSPSAGNQLDDTYQISRVPQNPQEQGELDRSNTRVPRKQSERVYLLGKHATRRQRPNQKDQKPERHWDKPGMRAGVGQNKILSTTMARADVPETQHLSRQSWHMSGHRGS